LGLITHLSSAVTEHVPLVTLQTKNGGGVVGFAVVVAAGASRPVYTRLLGVPVLVFLSLPLVARYLRVSEIVVGDTFGFVFINSPNTIAAAPAT
jgi:hypothetical protein